MAPKHSSRQLRILPGFVAVVIAEEIEEMMSFPSIFCRYFSFLGKSTAVLWEYTGNMFHFWGLLDCKSNGNGPERPPVSGY